MTMICDVDCPACKHKCWVNNGDIEDQTVPDVEAVECPYCKHRWLLADNDPDLPDEFQMTLEDANLAFGGKTPNDVI